MRVACVHEWLVDNGGAERLLEALLELYPDAPLYTLFWDRRKWTGTPIGARPVFPSVLNRLPGVARYYRRLLPLMPFAVVEDLERRKAFVAQIRDLRAELP